MTTLPAARFLSPELSATRPSPQARLVFPTISSQFLSAMLDHRVIDGIN
ncbi:hypothetical protein LRC39_12105 [Rhodopseudomonas sp. P1]